MANKPTLDEMRLALSKRPKRMAEKVDLTRLYRGGYNPEPYEAQDIGAYGGLFASGTPEPASSHGPHLHYTDIPTNKILTHYALNYEVPHEKVKHILIKSAPHVKEDKELFDKLHDVIVADKGQDLRYLDDDEIYNLLRKEPGTDADNEAQRLRGQIAKHLGYHAVELEDEHGQSYLTTHGVKFKPYVTKSKGGEVLPHHQREANKAKFLEGAESKERMYHATGDDFNEFDHNKSSEEGKFGQGIYITPQTRYANFFANIRAKQGKNSQIMPVHTNIKNPYKIHGHQNIPFNKIDKNKLQALGHDGIFFYDDSGDLKEAVAFHPTQVKSAIGNRGTYDINEPDITKAKGGNVMPKYQSIEEMLQKLQESGRTPIMPAPDRWFKKPEQHPFQQKAIEKLLAYTGHNREAFPHGAHINPVTGEPLDFEIMNDLRVAIDPTTGTPRMSGIKSGLTEIDPKLGSLTKSNLIRKGLFKHEGGDPLLDRIKFLATIEKSGKGHHYGLSTHYESPAELVQEMRGNPTLRPHSRGDIYGVGDEVGRISIKGMHHPVFEKLVVAPSGMNVQGKKLHKANGGKVTHAHHLEIEERPL